MLAPNFQPQLGRTVVEAGNANLQVLSTALTRKDGISDSPCNGTDTEELGTRPCRSGGKELGARPCRSGGRLVVEGRSPLRQEKNHGDGKCRYRSHHRRHRHCCKMRMPMLEMERRADGRVTDRTIVRTPYVQLCSITGTDQQRMSLATCS